MSDTVPVNTRLIQAEDDDPKKMETMAEEVPLNTRLLMAEDDDPKKIETMADHPDIPLSFRFVHVGTEDGELIMARY